MANATVALPAGQRRLRQEGLPRVPANPRTLTYPRSHRDTAHTRTKYSRAFPSPCAAGGLQGGQVVSTASSLRRKPQSSPRPPPVAARTPLPWSLLRGRVREGVTNHWPLPTALLPLATWWRGGRGVRPAPRRRSVSAILERMFPWAARLTAAPERRREGRPDAAPDRAECQ